MSIPKKSKKLLVKRIASAFNQGMQEFVSERVTARISKPLAPTPKPINLNKRHNKSK